MKRGIKRLQFELDEKDLQRIKALEVATNARSEAAVVRDAIVAYDKLLSIADPEDIIEVVNSQGQIVFKGSAKLVQ